MKVGINAKTIVFFDFLAKYDLRRIKIQLKKQEKCDIINKIQIFDTGDKFYEKKNKALIRFSIDPDAFGGDLLQRVRRAERNVLQQRNKTRGMHNALKLG